MKKQLLTAILAALKGLAYIVLLPLIGIFIPLILGIYKLAVMMQTSSKSREMARQIENLAHGVLSRR